MLDEEIHSVQHSLQDTLARQQMDLETYLKVRKLTMDELIETGTQTGCRQTSGTFPAGHRDQQEGKAGTDRSGTGAIFQPDRQ